MCVFFVSFFLVKAIKLQAKVVAKCFRLNVQKLQTEIFLVRIETLIVNKVQKMLICHKFSKHTFIVVVVYALTHSLVPFSLKEKRSDI